MLLNFMIIISVKPVACSLQNVTIPHNNPGRKIRTGKALDNRQYEFNESLNGSEALQLEYWNRNKQCQSWHIYCQRQGHEWIFSFVTEDI